MSTWREVARELGQRLEHQAAQCGATRNAEFAHQLSGGCDHDPATSYATADACPFCADHAAWSSWVRKEQMASARALRRARAPR